MTTRTPPGGRRGKQVSAAVAGVRHRTPAPARESDRADPTVPELTAERYEDVAAAHEGCGRCFRRSRRARTGAPSSCRCTCG